MTMKRMNFYLADMQIKRLNALHRKTGLPLSDILRRAIDEYWENYERKKKSKKPPKMGGWTEGGELNGSSRGFRN